MKLAVPSRQHNLATRCSIQCSALFFGRLAAFRGVAGVQHVMNFQQLRIIRETVRRNFNLTDVANALLTSQSGVSKQIKDLEDEIGVELFIRRGKRLLGLTEPGKALIDIVERMLIDAANIKHLGDHFSKRTDGELTIATTHTQARYNLPEAVKRFKEEFPRVHLVLHQANPKEIAAMLIDGKADIGIATDTIENNPYLSSFPYLTWEHAVVVPAGHQLAKTKAVTLQTLADWPIVTYDEGLTGRLRIDSAFAELGIHPQFVMSALDADVIKAYVQLGLGVGIVASIAFDPSFDRGLVRIDSGNLFQKSTSSIAIRRGRFLQKFAYRFIELCSPKLNEKHVRSKSVGSEALHEFD